MLGLGVMMLVVSACTSGDSEAEDSPATTVAASEVTDVNDESATTESISSPVFVSDAELLTLEFSPVDEGIYRLDSLGTPFSVEIIGDWFVQPNSAALVVFSHPDSGGPGDRDVVFLRPAQLSDPVNPTSGSESQSSWPAEDIPGWIDGLIDGVTISDIEDVSIGGREAVRFDVEIADDSICGPQSCIDFTTNNDVGDFAFDAGFTYRVHWVDMGEFGPVAIITGWPSEDDAFESDATALLSTVAFGDPQANPIPDGAAPWELGLGALVPPGLVQLPTAGGIEFDLAQERFIDQFSGFAAVTLDNAPGDFEILTPLRADGGPDVKTVDDALAAVESLGVVATEIEPATFPLGAARVFDMEGSSGTAGTKSIVTTDDALGGWRAPRLGRMWLFDTERGVIMVTAEAGSADNEVLAEAVALAEEILPTLVLASMPDGRSARSMADAAAVGEPSGDGILLTPGVYTSDQLDDVFLAWKLEDDLTLMDEFPGLVGVGLPGALRTENHLAAVFTATGIPGPDEGDDPLPLPSDVGAYIEGISQFEVSDSGTQTISSVEASWWDLTVVSGAEGTFPCPFGESCFPVLSHTSFPAVVIGDEFQFRLWSIPDPDGQVFALVQASPEAFDSVVAGAVSALNGLRVLPFVEPVEVDDSNLDQLGRSLADGPLPLEPGQYFTENMPFKVSLELASPLELSLSQPTHLALIPAGHDPVGPLQSLALLQPIRGVADPDDIGGPEGPPAFIDVPDDLQSWLDEIPQLEVTDSGTGTIGGIASSFVDLRVIGAPERRGTCGDLSCFALFDWQSGPWIIDEESPQRIWTVPHPAGTIFVLIEAPTEVFDQWADEVQPVIDSLSFG